MNVLNTHLEIPAAAPVIRVIRPTFIYMRRALRSTDERARMATRAATNLGDFTSWMCKKRENRPHESALMYSDRKIERLYSDSRFGELLLNAPNCVCEK